MKTNDTQTQDVPRIYDKPSRTWNVVSKEVYRYFVNSNRTVRKKMQDQGQCVCTRQKWWLCDSDCLSCEFHRAGNCLSLNYEYQGIDGETPTLLDTLSTESSTATIDQAIDSILLQELFQRLDELLPGGHDIIIAQESGISDTAIAKQLGIPRTTLLSRLEKARKTLRQEFPDLL
ncbi:sigma-70 family RNA polymerase sigma factor [Pectinatus cerevisiiphilus]|uniref:Uncharacterized protein n=1 Tax=Pectinatus cerevisiiphilus TaxID=86956 RepID=A0A4R3K4F2_9FIRM|nr:sigma-70 family RNA polymerase sigma factor [Pectinatus cerevisiiphilus]TCS77654.1 hypothetical protein EDC37_11455 [Pectinatus cerevisiiphilus]